MKVDWQKRYRDLERGHKQMVKQLTDEFGPLQFVGYDIARMDFGSAKMRCEIHLRKMAMILGVKYCDYSKGGNQ